MSQYSRNERNANAGIVVGITPADCAQRSGAAGPVDPLDGIAFQRFWESRAYELGGGGYIAPGQLVGDFIRGQRFERARRGRAVVQAGRAHDRARRSGAQQPADVRDRRHPRGAARLRAPDQGLLDARRGADRRRDTHLVAAAHRARRATYQSINVAGLYPAGEGAGYAGGIMSAGVDGIEVAEAIGAGAAAQPARHGPRPPTGRRSRARWAARRDPVTLALFD